MVSLGLVIASGITVSLASVDLDSMLTAQYALFICLLIACVRFTSTLYGMTIPDLLSNGKQNELPPRLIGDNPFDAVGPVLFNYAFVVTAPPLVCGASNVKMAMLALATACAIMGTLYTVVGWGGGPSGHKYTGGYGRQFAFLGSTRCRPFGTSGYGCVCGCPVWNVSAGCNPGVLRIGLEKHLFPI